MLKYSSVSEIPQTEPLLGRKDMILNDAGGYVFKITDLQHFKRFLILGSSDGTYYVNAKDFTKRNVENIIDLIKANGILVIDTIVNLRDKCPKLSPSLYALALSITYGDDKTKKYGYSKITNICKSSYQLFELMQYIQELRGWSRGLRLGVAKWFDKPYSDLSYQFIKYRQREGWTHKDVLRLSHPRAKDENTQMLFGWSVGKISDEEIKEEYLSDFIKIQKAEKEKEVISLLVKNKFSWEMVPTQFLKSPTVWKALLPNLQLTAILRNLGKMASIGILNPFSNETNYICSKLNDRVYIEKSKVHPYQIALSLVMYNEGKGFKGDLSWISNSQIKDALENAFKFSFGNVIPTNKNIVLGVDISGSMRGYNSNIFQSVLDASQASAILSLIHLNTEANIQFIEFDTKYYSSKINRNDSVYSAFAKIKSGGGTDLAQPVQYALDKKISNVDAFIIYTDNETWAGKKHTVTVFNDYRKKYNGNCKLINVAMTATKGSIIDPKEVDSMLEVVGFNTDTPNIINQFIMGEI